MKNLILTLTLAFTLTVNAQDDKNVSLVVIGQGKTQDDAKQNALRSAIEQAFGTFISSKTEILKDNILVNQIISPDNGNIESFSILNETKLPNENWGVTLKAVMSINKLNRFLINKGFVFKLKDDSIPLNIKQQILNENGEIKVISKMIEFLHEPMQISFDYDIKSSKPKSIDAENKSWEIPLVVTATANKNINFCANYCIKIMSALSLTQEEISNYKNLNKIVLPVVIKFGDSTKTFNLRSQNSINTLSVLKSQLAFYTSLFTLHFGNDETIVTNDEYVQALSKRDEIKVGFIISFSEVGQKVSTLSWLDKRVIFQIEKMPLYQVKPRGVVSQIKNGGIVVYEENGHGLVLSIVDFGNMNWIDSKNTCDELILNSYDDWYLPSQDELKKLQINFRQFGIGGFTDNYYWSSTDVSNDYAWRQDFENSKSNGYYFKSGKYFVRAVRTF